MKIIQSLVEQIGGELRMGSGDNGRGARFTVTFRFSMSGVEELNSPTQPELELDGIENEKSYPTSPR